MLSFSIIVRNEEARLAGCLASVRDLADEMVVVDTGSTDATIAVAVAAGAHVEQVEWPGDFALANAPCHQNRAVALLMGGDIEGARAAFRTAVASVTSGSEPTKRRVDGGASRPLSRLPGLAARGAAGSARFTAAFSSAGICEGGT